MSVCLFSFKLDNKSLIIIINWLSQERLLQNPCWQSIKALYSSRWAIKEEYIICSKILQHIEVNETGL